MDKQPKQMIKLTIFRAPDEYIYKLLPCLEYYTKPPFKPKHVSKCATLQQTIQASLLCCEISVPLLPTVGFTGHKCARCKQPCSHPCFTCQTWVHPRNFHKPHLNICIRHHGTGQRANANLWCFSYAMFLSQ